MSTYLSIWLALSACVFLGCSGESQAESLPPTSESGDSSGPDAENEHDTAYTDSAAPDDHAPSPEEEACRDVAAGGPKSNGEPRRPVMPWKLSMGDGADGGTESGCVHKEDLADYWGDVCSGSAAVAKTEDALTLTFEDGSLLSWDSSAISNPVSQPPLTDGQVVWVRFTNTRKLAGDSTAGWALSTEIVVRPTEDGDDLFAAIESHFPKDLWTPLFGVTARQEAVCSYHYTFSCRNVERTLLEHVLETSPEQRIPNRERTQVVTPKGKFDVVWFSSEQVSSPLEGCLDGPVPASDFGFAASAIEY